MTRAVLWLLRLLLRVFFRHVEVVGQEQLPREGGIVFAPNHPNALIDPLFLLVLPKRHVSFLAKEPLFRMPVVGMLVRAMRCIPVYRARDGHQTDANAKSLAAARALLESGGAIGIFPEGTSHSGSTLVPLKTGAARIALGARAGSEQPVHVVPCALYYTEKTLFRSYAALVYGAPLSVPRVALDADGQAPREAVLALTEQIKQGLSELVLQADSLEVLQLVGSATRLIEGARLDQGEVEPLPRLDAAGEAGDVERDWRLSRLLLRRYAELQRLKPARVAKLSERIEALEHSLSLRGLNLREPLGEAGRQGRNQAVPVLEMLLAAPAACLGIVLHYPLYRAIGALAQRAAGQEEDVLATAKLLLGLLGFPLFWIACASAIGMWLGVVWGLVAAPTVAALAAVALWWSEQLDTWLGSIRGRSALASPGTTVLIQERDALYTELLALEELAQNSQVSEK